jgi:hypothetical protein
MLGVTQEGEIVDGEDDWSGARRHREPRRMDHMHWARCPLDAWASEDVPRFVECVPRQRESLHRSRWAEWSTGQGPVPGRDPDDVELGISVQLASEVDRGGCRTSRHPVPTLLEGHRDAQSVFAHRSVH